MMTRDNAMNEGSPHAEWEELAALAALETLGPAEATRLAEHLAGCAACRTAAADYAVVANKLLHSIPLVQAPSGGEARLRAAIRPQRPHRSMMHWATRAVAAAAVIVAVFFGVQNAQLRRDLLALQTETNPPIAALTDPAARPIALRPAADHSGYGRFVWAPTEPVASLALAGLPPAAYGRSYHLWFVQKDGTILHGGSFAMALDNYARVPIRTPAPWSTFTALFVTDEPASNAAQPTGERLIQGEFDG